MTNSDFKERVSSLVPVPDLGSRHSVRGRVVPLVERDAGVGRLVDTGDLDGRLRRTGAIALDLELEALNIELGLALVRLVEANVLDADEVLARGYVLLDGPLEAVLLPGAPRGVVARGRRVAEASLHHLDPVARAVVGGGGAGRLGDVDEAWARVLDEFVVDWQVSAHLFLYT